MKKSYLFIFVLSSISFLALSSCRNEEKSKSNGSDSQVEQKEKEVSPDVLFENEYAKVSEVTLTPGDFQLAHEGESRVIYSLSDYAIDWEEQGENLETKSWKKGEVHFHEAGTHAAKNTGTTTAEWLVFTRKNTELPECGENTIEDNDVNSVLPQYARVLLDNDDFKITEVSLPKGESIPMHSGINRIIYSLTDYQLMYESSNEEKGEKQFRSGDVHWHDACQHALENNGETEARFLVVSYKPKD